MVVVPPEEVVAALEPFRRLHDPAFHRHPPHLALSGPFDVADGDALLRRFTGFVAPSALVTFSDPCSDGQALVLPVRDEAGKVAALAQLTRVHVMPVSARLRDSALAPSLRVGVFSSDAERELARRSFAATVPRVPGFIAADVALLVEDVRGLWHEVRRQPLTLPGE